MNLNDHPLTSLAKLIQSKNPQLPEIDYQDIEVSNLVTYGDGRATVKVDLIGNGSEAEDDWVEFSYQRIPLTGVFSAIDEDTNNTISDFHYHSDDASALVALNGQTVTSGYVHDWFLSHLWVNITTLPITVSEFATGAYDVTMDNLLYYGTLRLTLA